MNITAEQLDGLRALRLHHWKGVLEFSKRIKHYETRLSLLGAALVEAKTIGKTRVTNAVLKPKRLPDGLVERLITSLRACVKDEPTVEELATGELLLAEIDEVRK